MEHDWGEKLEVEDFQTRCMRCGEGITTHIVCGEGWCTACAEDADVTYDKHPDLEHY